MKEELLDYLACPACDESFRLSGVRRDGAEVAEGTLECPSCPRTYPIRDGIPRILPASLTAKEQSTADSFQTAWRHYGPHLSQVLNADFLPVCKPWRESDFPGQAVLDVGCGAGRLSRLAARYGARAVVAVDLGGAIEVARDLGREFPSIHFVQASVFELPLKSSFDLAWSLGVIHHTPDPRGALRCLMKPLKPGGRIGIWVYGAEGNEIMGPLMNFFRVGTTRLGVRPRMMLAAVLVRLQEIYYFGFRRLGLPVFYGEYLRWFNEDQSRVDREYVAFDFLSTPLVKYISRPELDSWVVENVIADPVVVFRNSNSWSLTGVKKS